MFQDTDGATAEKFGAVVVKIQKFLLQLSAVSIIVDNLIAPLKHPSEHLNL